MKCESDENRPFRDEGLVHTNACILYCFWCLRSLKTDLKTPFRVNFKDRVLRREDISVNSFNNNNLEIHNEHNHQWRLLLINTKLKIHPRLDS